MKKHWWKILAVVLLVYTIVMGFTGKVPTLDILNETIRNLYFHVPMWFAMTTLLLISVIKGIQYLSTKDIKHDHQSAEFAKVGILFGAMGLITGSLWARFTWGTYWTSDPKLNGAAIGMLMYMAYLLLRSSFEDEQRTATLSSIYNIFAFCVFIPAIYILPRLTASLHPGGNAGNPGFSTYDLDSNLRMVFYPAVLGWILMGVWIATLKIRAKRIETHLQSL